MPKPSKPEPIADIHKAFSRVRAVVVGDVMLDEYTVGVIERLSPEAPVPIVVDRERRFILGGAANVAANVAALGGKVSLVGVVGDDAGRKVLRKLCRDRKIQDGFVVDASRRTTIKNRIIVGHHQVLRIDTEDTAPVSARTEKELLRQLAAAKADIVIFSDYAKGTVTRKLVAAAKKRFGARNIFADFKPSQAEVFHGVGVIFPNLKEAHELTGIRAETTALAEEAIGLLARRFGGAVVLKRSEHGMSLLKTKTSKPVHLTSRTREVFDVTGAGDTVIAAMALALAAGASFETAADVANHAAGIVVEKEGTAVVSADELGRRLEEETT